MDISFNKAYKWLQDQLPLELDWCASKLYNMLVPCQSLLAVHTYFPEDFKKIAAKQYLIEKVWNGGDVEEDALAILRRHFPVSEMAVEWLEDAERFVIHVEPMGPQWNYDSFGEDMEDPTNLSENAGPDILIQLLDMGWDEDEDWAKMIEFFGWPIRGKPKYPDQRWWINLEKMYRRLRKRGLGRLVWLWKANTHTTGNIYWDIDMYDESSVDEGMYEPEAIPMLMKKHERAQRICQLYFGATKMVVENPELVKELIKAYKEAMQLRGKN